MNMILNSIYFCIFVTLLTVYNVNADNSVCGNWLTYKDEKCFKIFDKEKLVTFEDAIKSCSQIDNSSQILTIHSKEEQDFISEYLFKTNKLLENVWIGLKNKTKSYEWTDSSNKPFINWKTGNPTNKPDYNCVQLEADSLQWINSPCLKKGLVVCQKLPEVTLSDLFKQVLETKDRLKITETELKDTKTELKETKQDLNLTKERLKKTEETRSEANQIFNVIFNNKVSHYHLFTDIDGKNKAFIIPLSAVREQYSFDDSVNLCKDFNSTLIEIQSLEKQMILESFIFGFGFDSYYLEYFYMNGLRDSSGKWKWLKSNTEFNFTNWNTNNPVTTSGYDALVVNAYSAETFGKWVNKEKAYKTQVMCEHTFGF